jgi:hypothetical protein
VLRRLIRGLDEMALEVVFIAVASLVGLVALYYASHSELAGRAAGIPLLGTAVDGVATLTGLVVKP